MHFQRIAVYGLASVLLSGCVSYKQDFVFSANGSMTMSIEFRIVSSLAAMSTQEGQSPFCVPDPTSAASTDPAITFTTSLRSEAGDEVCSIVVAGPIQNLMDADNFFGIGPALDDGPDAPFTVSLTQSAGVYRFTLAGQPDPPAKPEEGTPDFSSLLIATTAGRSLDWSVTAPTIISTTGMLSEDGRTASYSYSVATLLSQNPPPFDFTTDFLLQPPGALDWFFGLFK